MHDLHSALLSATTPRALAHSAYAVEEMTIGTGVNLLVWSRETEQ